VRQGPFVTRRRGIVFKIEVRVSTGQIRTGWIWLGYNCFARAPWSERIVWDAD
jgi:hypothetical protein